LGVVEARSGYLLRVSAGDGIVASRTFAFPSSCRERTYQSGLPCGDCCGHDCFSHCDDGDLREEFHGSKTRWPYAHETLGRVTNVARFV